MRRIRKRGGRAFEVRIKDGGVWRWLSTGTHDRTAAEGALREHERRAADPAYGAEAEASTEALLREYLASRRARGRSEGTLHHYRTKFGTLVRLLPPAAKDITHAVLEAYLAARVEEGVAQTTVKKEFRALKAALVLARKNGRFSRDPDAIVPELADTYQPRKRALTRWELVALASELPPDRAAHVVWIVATGARWGESVRARRSDCTDAAVYLRGTKTDLAARQVPVLEHTRPLLDWAIPRGAGKGTLFRPWTNVRRDLAEACAELGMPPVTPNDLRRTFAAWLRQGGAEPALIGQAMGHADSRMVERVYGRLEPAELGTILTSRLLGSAVPNASHPPASESAPGPSPAQEAPTKPR